MIRVRRTLRTVPCVVNGVRCRFHRFVEDDRVMVHVNALLPERQLEELRRKLKDELVFPSSADPKILRKTWALVEYPDGSLRRVDPEEVRFVRGESR